MAQPRLRASAAVERLRESLWLIPGTMVAGSVTLALLLVRAQDPARRVPLQELLLPATADTAVPVLQVVSASVITVTSVVFSLTVVALQMTAGNYSPRALRTFLRDLGTQIVLGTFLATFAYSYVVLQNVHSTFATRPEAWTPRLAFLMVPGFVLASLVALVFFIHHVTQAIRVDLILKEVMEENLDSIDTAHPLEGVEPVTENGLEAVPERARAVRSSATGFVQSFGLTELLETLEKLDLVVVFRPTVGDHVLQGGVLAWVWGDGGDEAVTDEVEDAIRGGVQIGRERSMNQDVAYGIRQLVDIAVRSMSAGVNDPNTAVAALFHLSTVYRKLLLRRLGPVVAADEGGDARVTIPYPSFEEYLAITVQQVGHYSRSDLMVLLRLLRELAELKSLAPPERHEAFDRAMDELVKEAEQGLDVAGNLAVVREAARDAKEQRLHGRHHTAAG